MIRYRFLASLLFALGGALLVAGALLTIHPQIILAQEDGAQDEDAQAISTSEASPSDAGTQESEAQADTTPEASIQEASAQADNVSAASASDDSYCLLCHAQPDQTFTLADGSALDITVDPQAIAQSVHGNQNESGALGCTECHRDYRYPHEEPLPANHRAYTIQQSATVCTTCHEDQTAQMVDSVHFRALENGNLTAASCVDCHGAHNVQPPAAEPQAVAQACGNCHQAVFEEFQNSVHGAALLEGDTNVPTCTSCHGVHGIQNPTTALFRNRSPELCADCHANDELMAQYGISTYVFETYLTDFHGTTVALFEQQDPNVPTNKAVCIDCHGVHDIVSVDTQNSRVVRENLLETCQQCHPGATSDFPDAWVGHFPPTAQSHPLLFAVTLFYNILIPVTIGGFIFLIATDVVRRLRRRG